VVARLLQVGDHERRAWLPGQAAQRAEIGNHRHVAVALFPAGEGIAVDRVELDVDREQIIAAFGTVRHDVFHEESR